MITVMISCNLRYAFTSKTDLPSLVEIMVVKRWCTPAVPSQKTQGYSRWQELIFSIAPRAQSFNTKHLEHSKEYERLTIWSAPNFRRTSCILSMKKKRRQKVVRRKRDGEWHRYCIKKTQKEKKTEMIDVSKQHCSLTEARREQLGCLVCPKERSNSDHSSLKVSNRHDHRLTSKHL